MSGDVGDLALLDVRGAAAVAYPGAQRVAGQLGGGDAGRARGA
jgi:hypothetical protein